MAEKIHFPGLNGLRFYAAFLVLVSHVEVARSDVLGTGHLFAALPVEVDVGSLAVRFFFVLSGFLITYLLVTEVAVTGTIGLRDFYLRRALRIAPLYYLTLFLALACFPLLFPDDARYDPFQQPRPLARFLLYAAFLPNVGLVAMPIIPGAGHLWSIGVEQQFYAVWPWLVRAARRRLLPVLLAGIAAKTILTYALARLYAEGGAAWPAGLKTLYRWTFFPVEYMAIGAVGACLVFAGGSRLLDLARRPWVERVNLFILLPSVFLVAIPMPGWLIGTIFAVLIVNVACNPRSLLRLDDPVHRRLGEISYGVYMLHPLALFAALAALRRMPSLLADPLALNLALYGLVLSLTYAGAALSYRYFERPFLERKRRFARVASTP